MDENSNTCSPLSYSHQSQKLQTFLSDLEGKLRTMKALIEEHEKAPSDRNEICQNKKPELVQRLEELSRSYHSFAEEIYPLRFKSHSIFALRHSSSSSNVDENLHPSNKTSVIASDDPHNEAFEGSPGSTVDDLMCTEQCNLSFLADEAILERFRFSKLVEENLQQKEELLRRNEEKRSTINMLRLELECLKGENRALQECLGRSVGLKRSRSQRIKGLFWNKFFKRGCS